MGHERFSYNTGRRPGPHQVEGLGSWELEGIGGKYDRETVLGPGQHPVDNARRQILGRAFDVPENPPQAAVNHHGVGAVWNQAQKVAFKIVQGHGVGRQQASTGPYTNKS